MNTKDKEKLLKSMLALLALVWSFATFAATALYLYVTFSPAGELPPRANQFLILGVVIFLIMTLLGALAMGRRWRGAPAGIAVVAATPYFLLCPWDSGWVLVIPGMLTFTIYYLISRCNAGTRCCRPHQT